MEWSVTALEVFGIPSAIARKMADPTHHHMSVWLPHLNLQLSKGSLFREFIPGVLFLKFSVRLNFGAHYF